MNKKIEKFIYNKNITKNSEKVWIPAITKLDQANILF